MPTITQQYIEAYPIADATPHPHNPRSGDVGAISESIKHNGFYGSLVIQKSTKHILAGNHRAKAAIALGITEVPAVIVDCDDDTARRILLADNRTNDLADYDNDALTQLLASVYNESESLAGTGYDGDDLDQLLADLAYDDDVVEPEAGDAEKAQKRRGVKLGDVYTNGEITLICGDSTEASSWEKIRSIDAMVTSPPYLDLRSYGEGFDNHSTNDWEAMMTSVYTHSYRIASSGSVALTNLGIVHRDRKIIRYWDKWIESVEKQWDLTSWYVWDKGSAFPGAEQGRMKLSHEWIFHHTKAGTKSKANKSLNSKTKVKNTATFRQHDGSMKQSGGRGKTGNSKKVPESVMRVNSALTAAQSKSIGNAHPAMFPVELAALMINTFTDKNDSVCDPFSGAGSTLVAAWQTNRRATGIELDPRYVAVTLDRLEKVGATLEKQ